MNLIAVSEVTPEAFAPSGELGAPSPDGDHAAADVVLGVSHGTPRFYLMRLTGRDLVFPSMARHDRVTRCLGAGDGKPWLVAVAAAGIARPGLSDIRAFRFPGDRLIKLARGTWHAGPYFAEPHRGFYNLEPADTNTADCILCRLETPVAFVS